MLSRALFFLQKIKIHYKNRRAHNENTIYFLLNQRFNNFAEYYSDMQEFIVAIRELSPVGFIATPYFAERTNENFYTITESLNYSHLESMPEKLDDTQKKIITIAESYSKNSLTKIFTKGQKSHDFFKTVSEEDISKRIRPFIEEKLQKIIKILENTDIKIFNKADTYNIVHNEDLIEIKKTPAQTVFNITKDTDNTQYFLSIKHSGKVIELYEKHGNIITNNPCILILENKLYKFEDIDGKKLLPFFEKTHITIPASSERKWFEAFAVNAITKYEVNAVGFNIIEKNSYKKARLSLERDWNSEYCFILIFEYEKKSFLASNTDKTVLDFDLEKFEFTKYTRDLGWEEKIIAEIKNSGLEYTAENSFKIKFKFENPEIQRFKTIEWLNENSHIFNSQNIQIVQFPGEKKYFIEKISSKIKISENKDWFDINGVVSFGNFEIPFISLRRNIISGKKEFKLPDGTYAIIPDEWFAKYSQFMSFGKEENDTLKIKKHHYTLIKVADIEPINEDFYKNLENFESDSQTEFTIPQDIRAELRPYQKEGVKWLNKLVNNNFGACLADDMGLGKTLQTITLIQKTIDEKRKEYSENLQAKEIENTQLSVFDDTEKHKIRGNKASLIIMPVSLIHNWENEIMKFSPFLKVLKYRGNKREEKLNKLNKYDIILTGYGVARNDINTLALHDFLYVILDESQFIKNPDSKIYKALLGLKSDYRMVLTGTPIENSLSDLWAQMNFINEGMLGNFNFFKQNFINPIEKNNEQETKDRLKQLISPFILRRTKDQVAKDLPSLTEQVMLSDMSDSQKEIYESEKSKTRNYILENLNNPERKNTSLIIIQALTKLRQIANHPAMVIENYTGDSGKFDDIIRDIENITTENHKVLIFSSFVKHLNIFEEYFKQNNIEYSILTGQTSNREKVISEFQENKKNKIFLISIKAGGTGLNLTEADYVFILDPWWNPAVEKQAVSRAHRIGQDKKVMVYRYISRNTIEEKIRKLQSQKIELSDTFIESDNFFKDFSDGQILNLFD